MKIIKTAMLSVLAAASFNLCAEQQKPLSDFWKNATVYFMMTDRFNNGDTSNDKSYNRTAKPGVLRGFEGGDIRGIIDKIEEGYFTKLGVDALWMTPLIEQIHGYDQTSDLTYSYHGYWPKDWTAVDANFGTEADLKELVAVAHKHKMKVLMDVVINHTGPQTKEDWAWPSDWIRTGPICNWTSFEQNIQCALAESLTDVKTEIETDVALPPQLLKKWKQENRLEQELAELDAFFKRTGYPRAPKYYIVKWLTDWVKEYGIDGFRADTVKHVEPEIWKVLKTESEISFNTWKINNPELVMDDLPFYMVGEVYHWGVSGFRNTVEGGNAYDYGDKQVDFFDYGFDAMINMAFPAHASKSAEQIFSDYSNRLNNAELKNKGVLSYLGSHDDPDSYDRERKDNYDAAFKLMLVPGAAQIHYGDEIARPLFADKKAIGDAHLRLPVNWSDLGSLQTQQLLSHWQKLGQFRKSHKAVGAGVHQMLNESPYIFSRTLGDKDKVVAAKGLTKGDKSISVKSVFKDGDVLFDYYSGQSLIVKGGQVAFNSPFSYALIGKLER